MISAALDGTVERIAARSAFKLFRAACGTAARYFSTSCAALCSFVARLPCTTAPPFPPRLPRAAESRFPDFAFLIPAMLHLSLLKFLHRALSQKKLSQRESGQKRKGRANARPFPIFFCLAVNPFTDKLA